METLTILGTGIAGLTAAIYAARANLNPLLISGPEDGGQLTLTTEVENFPGFEHGILGPELITICKKQAERFGARFKTDIVAEFSPFKKGFELALMSGEKVHTRALIVATGASARWLGLPSEEKYKGRGVSTCATCLPTGSNIIANNSQKPINEIKENQRVLTHDGTFQKVVGTSSRSYKGPLVKIKSRYFREEPTILTPEHPVLITHIKRGKGSRYWELEWEKEEWVLAGNIKKGDILVYPVVKKTHDISEIKLSELLGLSVDASGYAKYNYETYTARRIPNAILINNDFMRLAGYFLAEGSITSRGFNLYFGKKDREWVQDSSRIIRDLFNYTARVKKIGSVYRVECYAGILKDFFAKLFGKYSYAKSLPHWFIYLPKEKQTELIRGYYRGDGGIKPKSFSLVTNSPTLVTQFKTILLRLGVIPSISKALKERLNKTKNTFQGREIKFKHDRYEMDIGGSWLEKAADIFGVNHLHASEKTRAHEFAWIQNGNAYLPVTEVTEDQYEGEVYNIAVENNNTYVTANAIVHNCDGALYKGKEVLVIGGGDSAMEEALFLTKFAAKITIIHRKDSFRASKIMQERALKHEKITVIWDSIVEEIYGDGKKVQGVKLKNLKNNKLTDFKCDGVFLAIGHVPNTAFLKGKIEMDENGYLKADPYTRTNILGVFAAGDVQDKRFRQAITAAGSGCMAAMEAEKWLGEHG